MNHDRDAERARFRALCAKLERRRHSARDIRHDSLVHGLDAAGARLFTDRAGTPESVRRYADSKLRAIAAADSRIIFNDGRRL